MPWEERVSALMVLTVTDTSVGSGLQDEELSSKTLRLWEWKVIPKLCAGFCSRMHLRYEVTFVRESGLQSGLYPSGQ